MDIAARNIAFVNFVDSCLGRLSANVRQVHFLMVSTFSFRIRVVLREESHDDNARLREALEDFEATLGPPYDAARKIELELLVEPKELSRVPKELGYLGVFSGL